MLEEVNKALVGIFGDRVAFHNLERMLYSSDVGQLPDVVTSQITTMPDAVVQPKNGQELQELVKVATQYKIPLVPRGAGTAGYGGAVPTKGGIVADFSRMNNIIEINKEKKTATVEPGVIWNELETKLRSRGLALRLYPGSAISATVGGWIANGGGVGIGSYEYGFVRDSIGAIEIITPSGSRTMSGDGIDLVYGFNGTTGFISRITILVREADEDVPVLAAFPTIEGLNGAITAIRAADLPLWEVGFKDPQHVKLTEEAVEKQAAKYAVGDHHKSNEEPLPAGRYIGSFVYPRGRDQAVRAKLTEILKANGGELLSDKQARFDWAERFFPMRLKAAGPSFIPSEVMLPTDKVPALAGEIMKKAKNIGFMGTLVGKGKEVSIMTYILDDERRRGFTFANAQSFIPIKAAIKLGGRPYGIGMLMTDMAPLALGADKLQKAYRFKTEIDPDYIMNPGKIYPATLDKSSSTKGLARLMGLARNAGGAAKFADAVLGAKGDNHKIGKQTELAKLPFGDEVQWDAFACANCGYCRVECPLFNAVGWESASPRGKFHFIREYLKGNVKMDQRMAELFSVCTTCRQCNLICQVKSNIDEDWGLGVKPALIKEKFQPLVLYQRAAHNVVASHNAAGQPQEKRGEWVTPDAKYKQEGELGYWAGCAASFTYGLRNLPINAMRILNKAGIEPVYLGSDEWCCGAPLFTAGTTEEATELIKHNVAELKKRGIKTLITSCPGCWVTLAHYYPILTKKLGLEYGIKIKHITEVIAELIEQGKIKMEKPIPLKVTYHDSCHIGRGGGIFEPPRKIITSVPGIELVEMPRNREHSACCGKHTMRYPALANSIHKSRVLEAAATGAEALVIACPTCESNFRIGVPEFAPGQMEVIDISDLAVESMGLPVVSISKLPKLLRKKKAAK
jgi:Fe-S oxidoreductase/FAD/FMN-containing dehydrogenase